MTNFKLIQSPKTASEKLRTRLFLALLAASAVAACSSGRDSDPLSAPESGDASAAAASEPGVLRRAGGATGEAFSVAGTTTIQGVPAAATEPLADLNLNRDEIPISLAAIDYVYESYPPPDCASIALEVARLDTDLGGDYDSVPQDDPTLAARGGEAVGDLVVDTIRGFTTDIIPFRSTVREVTGAEAFERRRSRAFAAGYARRAYLKGLALGQGCPPPAAPRVLVAPQEEED